MARPATSTEKEAWLKERVDAGVFARVLQDIEDRCLGRVRCSLLAEGWPARSWQQDGLLVEPDGPRLRGGGDADAAKARLEAAMRRAEASVRETEGLEAGLLVKDFYGKSVDDVLKRFAGVDLVPSPPQVCVASELSVH